MGQYESPRLTRMDAHVSVQRVASTTAIRADWTLERLLVTVDLVVTSQISFLREGHAADVAFEGAFS